MMLITKMNTHTHKYTINAIAPEKNVKIKERKKLEEIQWNNKNNNNDEN